MATHEALWTAVEAQALEWQSTPNLQTFVAQLPRNAAQRSTGIPGILQAAAAGMGFVGSSPLRLSSNLPLALSAMPQEDAVHLASFRQWMEVAARVEGAHRGSIEWLRSRLPGYPSLPAPQLAKNAALTSGEFCIRLPWIPLAQRVGLQLTNPPPAVAELLGAVDRRHEIDGTLSRLARAFSTTDEWQALDQARRSLDPGSRSELRLCRSEISRRLSPALVDDYEPNLLMHRMNYRFEVVEEEVSKLSGAAAEYSRAFAQADRLIETAASEVFGQRVCYPVGRMRCSELEYQPGDPPRLTFVAPEADVWPELGMVTWLDDPLVADAVWIAGTSFNWNQTGVGRMQLEADLLGGTSTAWCRT